mmetsp:Transcript_7249/g.11117  ORF Transcript_7249/g.11117 Transcript_7249/m.11117 type:complete len:197 (+) Transcript_7249:48-638(+)
MLAYEIETILTKLGFSENSVELISKYPTFTKKPDPFLKGIQGGFSSSNAKNNLRAKGVPQDDIEKLGVFMEYYTDTVPPQARTSFLNSLNEDTMDEIYLEKERKIAKREHISSSISIGIGSFIVLVFMVVLIVVLPMMLKEQRSSNSFALANLNEKCSGSVNALILVDSCDRVGCTCCYEYRKGEFSDERKNCFSF